MVGGANKKANSRETRKESQLKINESSSTRGEADKDEIEETTEKGKGRGTSLKQGKKESAQAKKQKTLKIEVEKIDEKDEILNNDDEEDAELDDNDDGEEEEEEEESEEVESIAQRKGKRNVKQKFVITKGTRVQLKEDKDMEEKLSVKKKLKGKKQKQILPAEIVSKPSKQIHKEKEDNHNNIPYYAAETPIKRKAESEKDQQIAVKQPLPASSKKKEKIEIKAEEKLKKISVAKQLFDDNQIQQESQKSDKNILENDKLAKNKKKKKDNLEVMLEKKNAELSKIEKKAAKKDSMLEQILKKIEQIKKEQQQGKSALSVLHSQCVNELFEEGSTGSLAKEKQQLVDGDGKINEEKSDRQNGLDEKGENEDNHDEDEDDNDEDDDDEDDDNEEESVHEIRKSNRRPAKPKQYADYDYQQKNKGNNKNNKAAILEELLNEAEQLKADISEIKSRASSQIEEIAMIQQNIITSQMLIDNSGTPPQSPQISNPDISSTLPNVNQNLPAKTGRKAGVAEKLNNIITEESSQNNEIEIQKIAEMLDDSVLGSSKQLEVIDGMKVPKKRGRKPKNAGSSEQNEQENSGEKDKLGKKNQSQPNRENLNLLNLFIQEAQKIQKNPTPERGVASATELTQSLASIPDGDVALNEKEEIRNKHRSHTLTSEVIEKKQSETSKDKKSENDMDEIIIEINVPNEDAGKVQEQEVQKEINNDLEMDGNITPNQQEIREKSQNIINNDNKAESGDINEHLETKQQLNQTELVPESQCSEVMVQDENILIEKNEEIEKLNQENQQELEKQNVQLDKQELLQEQLDGNEQNVALEDTAKQINKHQHQEETVSGQEPSQEIKENEDENSVVECLNKDDNNDQDTDFNRQKHCEQHSLNMSDVLHTRSEESIGTHQNQKEDHSQVQLPSVHNIQDVMEQSDLSNNTKINLSSNSEESKQQYSQLMPASESSLPNTDSTKQTNDTINSHTLVNNDFKYPENYDGDCQQLQSNNQICCNTPKKEKQSVSKKVSESSVEKRSPPSPREIPEILKQQEKQRQQQQQEQQQEQLQQQAKISPNLNNIKSDFYHKIDEQKYQSVSKSNSLKQSLDIHKQNQQLISSLEEQRGQDNHFVSQNHYGQMEIENANQEQLKQQHITDMSSVDKARMEFEEEENFFDDLTPISMPEESAHGTKDIAFDKIPQVRSLILQQQSQQYAANKSSYQMQQQQQFAQQQYLQQQSAASLSMKTAGKQKTYR